MSPTFTPESDGYAPVMALSVTLRFNGSANQHHTGPDRDEPSCTKCH